MSVKPDIETLQSVLNALERLVVRSGLPVSLNPGIKTSRLEELASQLPLEVPPEIRCVYEWKNGTSGNCSLMPAFHFLPFEEIVSEAKVAAEFRPKGWLPLFTRDGDSFYVNASPRAGRQVRFFWHEGDASSPGAAAFDSVQSLFETIAEAYRRRLFRAGSSTAMIREKRVAFKYLQAKDENAWDALKARLNPKSAKMWLPRRLTAEEKADRAVELHLEELRRYGKLKTRFSPKEVRTELHWIKFELGLLKPFVRDDGKHGAAAKHEAAAARAGELEGLMNELKPKKRH